MRRVVIELPEEEIKKLGAYSAELSRDVESLEVMHHVKHGPERSAILCRIRPKGIAAKLQDLRFRFSRFEILSEDDDGLIVYLEAEGAPLSPGVRNPPKVFLNFPFEVRAGLRRIMFSGDVHELKKFFRWLERMRVKFKVLSNSDVQLSPNSVLNNLTEEQRKALFLAYSKGYYNTPRKVNLETLARRQNKNKSTFAEHLLKAENRLISQVLAQDLGKTS